MGWVGVGAQPYPDETLTVTLTLRPVLALTWGICAICGIAKPASPCACACCAA